MGSPEALLVCYVCLEPTKLPNLNWLGSGYSLAIGDCLAFSGLLIISETLSGNLEGKVWWVLGFQWCVFNCWSQWSMTISDDHSWSISFSRLLREYVRANTRGKKFVSFKSKSAHWAGEKIRLLPPSTPNILKATKVTHSEEMTLIAFPSWLIERGLFKKAEIKNDRQ